MRQFFYAIDGLRVFLWIRGERISMMKQKGRKDGQAAAGQQVLQAMRRLMEEVTGEDPLQDAAGSGGEQPMPDGPPEPPVDLKPLLVETGTGLWRFRRDLVDRESGEPREGMQHALRRLEMLLDAWEAYGFCLRDHTGEVLPDSGAYGLKVITYEPTSGLQQEIVIETIRPTILFRDELLQMGEVVVGIPPVDEPEHEKDRDSRVEDRDEQAQQEARKSV
jgi:hypothetical protein